MRSYTKGLFGPVGFILGIQVVVLVASLLAASNLLSPFISTDSESKTELAENSLAVPASHSIFQIKEAISQNSSEDLFSGRSYSSLADRELQYVVQKGDTLASVWLKNGAPSLGAARAIEAIKQSGIAAPVLKRGDLISVNLSSQGDISKLSKRNKDGSTLVLSGSSSEGYDANLIKPNIIEVERSVEGSIINSFAGSAASQQISYETIDDVVDLFSNRIEFSKAIQPGDSYTITYIEKRCQETGQVLDIGPVLSASFKTGGKLYAAIRYKGGNGNFVYFNEKGEQNGNYFLRYPLKFSRISSTFAWARFHPVLNKSRPHKGVDFAAPVGTPIRSIGDGTIEYFGFKSSPGNMIKIKHSDRWSTVYMHMNGFAQGLRQGQRISKGDLIGYVGTTGLSTGAHLHFELWDNGKYIDPLQANLPSISQEGKGLPSGYLTARLQEFEKKHAQIQLASLGSSSKPKA